MKRLEVTVLVVLTVLAARLGAQDFAKADEIPLPQRGVVRFDGSGYEHQGYSPSQRSIIFRRIGSTEGIGGNPEIDYIFVDPQSGEIVREIPVSFNMYAVGNPSDEEEWAELAQQNDEMASAAEQEISRISDLDFRSYSDWIYGAGGVARSVHPEGADASEGAIYRYYVYDEITGWLKPIHESGEYIYNSDAISFSRAYLTGGGTMLMLEFFRSPIMEYDRGAQIYFVLSEEQTAQFFNEVGFASYGQRHYAAALEAFGIALSCFPDYTKAAYNAACMAALLGDAETSLQYLSELGRIRNERTDDYAVAAEKSLLAVDRDTDFNGVRADPVFVTGLKRIRAALH